MSFGIALSFLDNLFGLDGRVAVVTGGPGHTNSITGITTAWMALSPILSISGTFERALRDRGAHAVATATKTAATIRADFWSFMPLSWDAELI